MLVLAMNLIMQHLDLVTPSLLIYTFAHVDSDNINIPLSSGPLGFRESAGNSLQYFISGGMDPLLRGLLQDWCRAGDAFIKLSLLSCLPPLKTVWASLDIQRDCEHRLV